MHIDGPWFWRLSRLCPPGAAKVLRVYESQRRPGEDTRLSLHRAVGRVLEAGEMSIYTRSAMLRFRRELAAAVGESAIRPAAVGRLP
jgi:hypothetical protein